MLCSIKTLASKFIIIFTIKYLMMKDVLIVVPFDFTAVGEKALEYAVCMSEKLDAEIRLVHVTNSSNKVSELDSQLEKIITNTEVSSSIQLSHKTIVGSIFEDLAKYTAEIEANLIVMGTHGMRGMQHLLGSHAMKVIESSRVPFLIVQENTELVKVKDIAMFFDTSRESIQITHATAYLSSILNAKIAAIYEKPYDAGLRQRISINKGIVEDLFENYGVDYEFFELDEGKSSLNEIQYFVKNAESDVIAIAYYTENLIKRFDTFAQNLITNKQQKPCLIISAVATSKAYF